MTVISLIEFFDFIENQVDNLQHSKFVYNDKFYLQRINFFYKNLELKLIEHNFINKLFISF